MWARRHRLAGGGKPEFLKKKKVVESPKRGEEKQQGRGRVHISSLEEEEDHRGRLLFRTQCNVHVAAASYQPRG